MSAQLYLESFMTTAWKKCAHYRFYCMFEYFVY